MISERSDNVGLKSSKNMPMDISQNSLLSSDKGKKNSENKTNDIKQLNLVTERSINKKIKKQLENESSNSFDNFDNDIPKKKIDKKKQKTKKAISKIIVDDIENIYTNLVDKTNKKYLIQTLFLIAIAFLVRSSSVESIPIKRIVNGSLMFLPEEAVSNLEVAAFFIFLSLLIITLVSVEIFSYPVIPENIDT